MHNPDAALIPFYNKTPLWQELWIHTKLIMEHNDKKQSNASRINLMYINTSHTLSCVNKQWSGTDTIRSYILPSKQEKLRDLGDS